MTHQNGFIALLDVLGFTSLISGADDASQLESYQTLLLKAVVTHSGAKVEAVIFSDSIILTTADDTEASFLSLALRCSELMGVMLGAGIPLRGAISAGPYYRTVMQESAFVAGRPILEAHNYERRQDWVGVMIAPSALARLARIDLKTKIAFNGLTDEGVREFFERVGWAAAIQPAQIPFHNDGRNSPRHYSGYAVVPGVAELTPREINSGTVASLGALDRLRLLAPDPAAQAKFLETQQWLSRIAGNWANITEHYDWYLANPDKVRT